MFRTWEELTELEQAATLYSDQFKDVNGWRPRNTADWTLEQYDAGFKDLDDEIEYLNAVEANYEAQAIRDCEASIASMIEMGAGDRETAIRWTLDIEKEENIFCTDDDEIHTILGVPASYNWREGIAA